MPAVKGALTLRGFFSICCAAIHQRSAELDKINVLEDKIKEEVTSIHDKMEQMRRDMDRFGSETEAKNTWETRKKVSASSRRMLPVRRR